VLDRIVGYQVSPLLWDKVRRGISAGRVQTVALRLIVDREREIKAFQKQEYWTMDANLVGDKPPDFDARYVGLTGDKFEIGNQETADAIRAKLEKAQWSVRSVERKERRRSPAPPFTTSKFQQDASRKLRFSVRRAMGLAQRLYEGVELGSEGQVGLITYMRTDSVRVANEALTEVRQMIGETISLYQPGQAIIDTLTESELAPQIVERLYQHPEAIEALNNMSPAEARRQLTKLEGAIEAEQRYAAQPGQVPQPRRITKAPPPMRAPSGGANPPSDLFQLAKKEDATDFIRAWRARYKDQPK